MNQDWLSNLYKALWSKIGGRPWTHIIRDSQRRHPLLWMLLFGSLGIILGHLFW
ncbi:hypothetical protein ES703_115574 [subsurface metagenome]